MAVSSHGVPDPRGRLAGLFALCGVTALVLAGTVAPGGAAEAQSSAPTVRRISFFGLAEGDSTYYRGENVRIRIRFNQQVLVDVSGGSPYVDLVVGDETRRARFVRSATNRLDFAYTVQEGDADDDGVSLGANALALGGATVKSAADSTTDADPAHGEVGKTSAVRERGDQGLG